jgi:AraC-like DNA-binding protein
MRYAAYPPSPALAGVVECYWFLEGDGMSEPQAIIPDGRSEIVVHFGDGFERHGTDGLVRQDAAMLVGQLLAPIRLACRGRAGVAAIRLRPEASRAITGCAAAELAGREIDLGAIAGPVASLREQLALAASDAARVALLERWLARRVRVEPSRDVSAAVARILACPWDARLADVAFQAGIGRRQLERRFAAEVGMPPKTFARMARLQSALARIAAGATLAEAAVTCGYYDQPHMTRDFARLGETSPGEWREADGTLARLFVNA